MKRTIFILFLFLPFSLFCQLRHKVDSLLSLLKKDLPQDTVLVKIYNEIAYGYVRIHPDSSKMYAEKGLVLSQNLKYKKGIGEAYNNVGINFYLRADYENAQKYFLLSKKTAEELGDQKSAANRLSNIGILLYMKGEYSQALENYANALRVQRNLKDTSGLANTLNNIASVYIQLADYDKALKSYLEALDCYEKLGDKPGQSQSYNNIGIVYNNLNNSEKAIENYLAAVKISTELGDRFKLAPAYSNLGKVYQKMNDPKKATWYFTESLKLSRESNNLPGIAYNLSDLGSLAEDDKDYSAALKYYLEALQIHEKNEELYSVANVLNRIGNVKLTQGKNNEAKSYFDRSYAIASELKVNGVLLDCYSSYAALFKKQRNFKAAYDYMQLYAAMRDTILNEDKNKSMAEMQTRFDTDKKEKEIAILTKNKNLEELQSSEQQANIKKQKVAIYSSLGGITLALSLAFFVFKGYNQKKKANLLLEEKNEAIRQQKQVLEEKNIQITDSIEYAKSIQDAILPSTDQVKGAFADAFILFKPKDVVSGDFYWLWQRQGSVTLAAIDCVGHGVPGAFMALHSYNLLERIVKEKKDLGPSQILDQLNHKVLESLNQQNGSSSAKHGMDLAMIKIKGNSVEFSGARNPLVIVAPDKSIHEIKADRMYVGGAQGNFTANAATVEKGSMLYLFTDGYADQKGGPQNKKFFAEPLRTLFKEIAHLSCEGQRIALENAHNEWRGHGEQLDDILIIGIRV